MCGWVVDVFAENPVFYFSDAGDSLNDCRIMFLTEIYKIEEPGVLDGSAAGSDSPMKSRFWQKSFGCSFSGYIKTGNRFCMFLGLRRLWKKYFS